MNYYNEFDPKKAAWIEELIKRGEIPPGWVDTRSIHDVRPHELTNFTQHHFFAGLAGWSLALRLAGWPDTFPVRSGSCPCGPFSLAGLMLAEKDPRHLFPFFRDILTFLKPAITFGEQVASSLGRVWLSAVRADLEGVGNAFGAADLCSASVGKPHGRSRLYWFAADSRGVRVPRLEQAGDLSPPGQRRACSQADLQGIFDRPFSPGAGWPQPLLRSMDDGLSARVVGCHAAGDAIDPQLAAVFIRSAVEALHP